MWGIEEYEAGEGIGPVLNEYGIPDEQIQSWGASPQDSMGWDAGVSDVCP